MVHPTIQKISSSFLKLQQSIALFKKLLFVRTCCSRLGFPLGDSFVGFTNLRRQLEDI